MGIPGTSSSFPFTLLGSSVGFVGALDFGDRFLGDGVPVGVVGVGGKDGFAGGGIVKGFDGAGIVG